MSNQILLSTTMPVSVTRSYHSESSSRYGSSYSPSSFSTTYRSQLPSSYRSNTFSSSYRSTSGIDSLREKSTESSYSSIRPSTYSSYRSPSGLDSSSREKSDSSDSAFSSTSKGRDYSKSRSSLNSADGNLKTGNVVTRRSSTSLYPGSSLDISRYSLSNYVPGTSRSSSTSRPPRYSSVRDTTTATTSTSASPSATLRSSRYTDLDAEREQSSPIKTKAFIEQRGLTGLNNIGNTCFLNSIVQCLSNTKVLLDYILTQKYINEIRSSAKSALMKRFSEVIKNLWQGEKTSIPTHSFKTEVDVFAPRFSGYSQQDAQEFLRYLLEGLHDELNRITTNPKRLAQEIDDNLSDTQKAVETWKRYLRYDNSKIVDTFGGLLKSILKCTHCGHCSTTFEAFWDLSLPIPDNSPVPLMMSHCLDLFTKEEVLDGDEMPTCSKCNVRRKCTKRILIQKFPEVLVIHLKRFSLGGRARKVDSAIEFPITNLNMGDYSADSQLRDLMYDLYGVVNHNGTCHTGHYTAYCRHPYSGDWHMFNDRIVTPVSIDSVSKRDAYVLFYEQSTSTRL